MLNCQSQDQDLEGLLIPPGPPVHLVPVLHMSTPSWECCPPASLLCVELSIPRPEPGRVANPPQALLFSWSQFSACPPPAGIVILLLLYNALNCQSRDQNLGGLLNLPGPHVHLVPVLHMSTSSWECYPSASLPCIELLSLTNTYMEGLEFFIQVWWMRLLCFII